MKVLKKDAVKRPATKKRRPTTPSKIYNQQETAAITSQQAEASYQNQSIAAG